MTMPDGGVEQAGLVSHDAVPLAGAWRSRRASRARSTGYRVIERKIDGTAEPERILTLRSGWRSSRTGRPSGRTVLQAIVWVVAITTVGWLIGNFTERLGDNHGRP